MENLAWRCSSYTLKLIWQGNLTNSNTLWLKSREFLCEDQDPYNFDGDRKCPSGNSLERKHESIKWKIQKR